MATAKSTTNEGASAKQTKPKKKPGRKSTKVKLPEGLIRKHLQIPLSKICLKTTNWISGSMTTVFVRQRSLTWHNGSDSQGRSISTI